MKRPLPSGSFDVGHSESQKKRKQKKKKKQRKFDVKKYRQRYVALHIAYFGHKYRGFASQSETTETVENYLFEALTKTCLIADRKSSSYSLSGRTDAGVSAVGQVVSLYLRSKQLAISKDEKDMHEEELLPRNEELDYVNMLNRLLPADIKVLAWSDIPSHFSARFSAVSRVYRYYFPKRRLNILKMRKAAQSFIGEHDFRNFCKMNVVAVSNFKRKIFRFDISKVKRDADGNTAEVEAAGCENDMYMFEIEGTAFLWHQVRMMTAVLFMIGSEKEEVNLVSNLLDITAHPRRPQYNMSDESPLVLYKTNYTEVAFSTTENSMKWLLNHYENLWYEYSVKACMMREFISVAKGTYFGDSTKSENDRSHIFKRVSDYIAGHENHGRYVNLLNRATALSYDERISNLSEKRLEERNRLINQGVLNEKTGVVSERERAIQGRDGTAINKLKSNVS